MILKKKKSILVIICAWMLILLTACAAQTNEQDVSAEKSEMLYEGNNYAMDGSVSDGGPAVKTTDGSSDVSVTDENSMAAQNGRKLIKDVSLNIETKEFEVFNVNFENEVSDAGGYIEYSSVEGSSYEEGDSGRTAWFTARIPEDKLEDFISKVGENGNITNISRNVRDITLDYVDVEGRISTLEAELAHLNELLTQASSLEDVLAIESKISDVRYELETYQSQMNTYDNLIQYSTVTVTVKEVLFMSSSQGQSVWSRIQNGFLNSIYNLGRGIGAFFIGLIIGLPYIIAAVIIIAVILVVFRKSVKKRKKKDSEEKEADEGGEKDGK